MWNCVYCATVQEAVWLQLLSWIVQLCNCGVVQEAVLPTTVVALSNPVPPAWVQCVVWAPKSKSYKLWTNRACLNEITFSLVVKQDLWIQWEIARVWREPIEWHLVTPRLRSQWIGPLGRWPSLWSKHTGAAMSDAVLLPASNFHCYPGHRVISTLRVNCWQDSLLDMTDSGTWEWAHDECLMHVLRWRFSVSCQHWAVSGK